MDAAEKLILEKGTHALSIANVAQMAGVSKGGIQSNFGTRDKLISDLLERWEATLQEAVQQVRAASPSSTSEVEIQVQATRLAYENKPKHHSAMMILVTQSNDLRARSRDWFDGKLAMVQTSEEPGKGPEVALLINQALIAIRSLGFVSLADKEWDQLFKTIDKS